MVPIFHHSTAQGRFIAQHQVPRLEGDQFFFVNQVHGNCIVSLSEIKSETKKNTCDADGITFSWKELSSGAIPVIKTADCLALAYLGKKGGALVHAGWKGLKHLIHISPALKALQLESIIIGPCIRQTHYEVGQDFTNWANPKCLLKKNGALYFDLAGQAKMDFEHHFTDVNIIDSGIDTFSRPDLPSFRREKSKDRIWHLFLPK